LLAARSPALGAAIEQGPKPIELPPFIHPKPIGCGLGLDRLRARRMRHRVMGRRRSAVAVGAPGQLPATIERGNLGGCLGHCHGPVRESGRPGFAAASPAARATSRCTRNGTTAPAVLERRLVAVASELGPTPSRVDPPN
jgi:hypothetical protein